MNTTDSNAMAQARTGGDGRFQLGPLRPVYRNPFDLLVDAPGSARQYVARGSYSVYPGIDADLGTIQVERGGVFTGRVLDADGTPCPNAPIKCLLSRNILGERVSWDGPALDLANDRRDGMLPDPAAAGCRLLPRRSRSGTARRFLATIRRAGSRGGPGAAPT